MIFMESTITGEPKEKECNLLPLMVHKVEYKAE
jgi:hypothetical protein